MINLKDLTYSELEDFVISIGEKKYRAKQIYEWLYRGVSDFDEMSNLLQELRQRLSEVSYIGKIKIEEKFVSKVDETVKYLLQLEDKNYIESVLMKYKHGYTVCISTQVGCRMGCKFCASALGGFVRSLTPGEMLDEVMTVQKDLGERVSNIVLMGIGEPLDNYDNVLKFLSNANHPYGFNIGARHISLSTCGLADKIRRLADENMQITLSVSLHAVDDNIRSGIMPVNKKYNIEELIGACKYYFERTSRRISFEYALINGANDGVKDAVKLAELLKGMTCYVNLIPINYVKEAGFKQSNRNVIEEFRNQLISKGINATIRRELGSDINASCGQLRLRIKKEVH